MNLFNRIRFKIIDFLVGDATYIRNATFDWNESYIGINDICYWSNTHTNGNPNIIMGCHKVKLADSALVSK